MLTRSKQRLIANNENINKENSLKSLKRKRTTKTKTQTDKENVVPTRIGYALRSRSKPKENVLLLKQNNENIVNRGALKEKIVKSNNILNSINEKPFKANILKDHNTIKSNISKPLKEKVDNKAKLTKANTNTKTNIKSSIQTRSKSNGPNVDPNFVVLIDGSNNRKKPSKDIQKENNKKDTTDINEPNNKRVKIETKKDNKVDVNKDVNSKSINNTTSAPKKVEENDQKNIPIKPSILKKKSNVATKRKEKVTFDDKVKDINSSLNLRYKSSEQESNNSSEDINIKKIDDSSLVKKHSNELIVPFVRSDSESDFDSSKSTISSIITDSSSNGLTRKSSDLSDKSLELLAEFNRGGGKVQIADILESLNCNGNYKSSTPNNFNKTLLFLEESPINYTRILNEEMSFHTPLDSSSFKSPEKEVSTISQNTSFQDSNSLSNFINISPISNSHLHRTDSDISHLDLQPSELLDESDLFNTDDKLLYSADELDEKIKKLLSGNNNFNLVSDDDNKSNLRYKPISPVDLNKKRKNRNENATNIIDFLSTTSSKSQPTKPQIPIVEELNYDQPESIDFNQDSSSDDPFGFSKAEKIYKSKQQQIKSEGPRTPISTPRYYASKKESHSLDNVNEILLQEHQQILESKKKNRNRKKMKIEDMEKLDSDDLEEIKKAKDEQIKLFKEIDDYVLNETVL